MEKIFFEDSQPWNSIEKDRVGVTALRTRLQGVITGHTRREFPKVRKSEQQGTNETLTFFSQVKSEISKMLKDARGALQSLGAERDTPEKRSRFLFDILKRFQEVTSLALATKYGADDLFEEHSELRIVTEVVLRNDLFSDHMHDCGQEYWFDSVDEPPSTHSRESSFTFSASPARDPPPLADTEVTAEEPNSIHIRTLSDSAELQDILHGQDALTAPLRGIVKWLEATYMNSRGFELGTFEPNLLSNVMKKQSVKWKDLALGYISDVVVLVHRFIRRLLASLCADERVRENLLSILMDPLLEKYRIAIDEVQFLLRMEMRGTPMTENHYFNDSLQIW